MNGRFTVSLIIFLGILMIIPGLVYASDEPVRVNFSIMNPIEEEGLPVYLSYSISMAGSLQDNAEVYTRYSLFLGNVELHYRQKSRADAFTELLFHKKKPELSMETVKADPGHSGFYRDRIRRMQMIEQFHPGIYEIKLVIHYRWNGDDRTVASQIAELEIKEIEGQGARAYGLWKEAVTCGDRKNKLQHFQELVRMYPGTKYACYARMDLAVHTVNKVTRKSMANGKTRGAYEQALGYVIPVVQSDMFVGCKDYALDIARICYEKLGEEEKAREMADKLIAEFPDSEFTEKVKRLRNS